MGREQCNRNNDGCQIYERDQFHEHRRVGLLYCSENKSFTVPFKIKSLPLYKFADGIWPERWAFPFEIEPFSTPDHWLGLGTARKLWSRHTDHVIPTNQILGINGLTVFMPNYVNPEDWRLTLEEFGTTTDGPER